MGTEVIEFPDTATGLLWKVSNECAEGGFDVGLGWCIRSLIVLKFWNCR